MSPDRIDNWTENESRDGNPKPRVDAQTPGGWALLTGLLLAPAAWILQTNLGQTIAAYSCFPHERPVSSPALPWMMHALIALSIVTLLLGVIGTAVALRNWRCTSAMALALPQHRATTRRAARIRFIARVGMISSGLFMFGLVATDMAELIVSPCGGGLVQ